MLALAVSADPGAMRAARPCGSERAAARIGGAEAEAGAEVEQGTGLGLGLGLRLGFDVGSGVGRCLGGAGRGAGEHRRVGEADTSERRESSESESAAWREEYIADDGIGGAGRWVGALRVGDGVEELEGDLRRFPAKHRFGKVARPPQQRAFCTNRDLDW